MSGTIDTESLPAEEARILHEMIETADFFELPEQSERPSAVPDTFQYRLVVEDGGRRHVIETTDAAAPDTLRPLLRKLTMLARSQG